MHVWAHTHTHTFMCPQVFHSHVTDMQSVTLICKGKGVPVHSMKTHGDLSLRFIHFNQGTRWSIQPHGSALLSGKYHWYQLNRRVGGLRSQSGHF
jgi:hypothetical protein